MSSIMSGPTVISEIKTPFQINGSTGAVDYMTDPVQKAVQHILALCFTNPGERVMNPTYGVGIQSMLFENSTAMEFQAAALSAQAQLQSTDGQYFNVQVTVQPSPQQQGSWVFQVQFQIYADPQVHYAVFTQAGALIGAS